MAGAQQSPPPPEPPPPPAVAPPATPDAPGAPAANPNAPAAAPGTPAAAPGAPGAAPQGAPGAQPAPPPAAPPPPPQPATQPPPPVSPPVTFGATPATASPILTSPENVGPDKTIEDDTDKEGPPLRWRGTTFTWNQAATTTLVGVGRDNIGNEHEAYGWAFNFRPRYFLIDLPKDKLTVSADIGWEVELTDSGLTTDRYETQFQDLAVGMTYSRVLLEFDKGEYKTSGALAGRLRFPTSKFSIGQGKYLTTSLGPSLNQQIKILGKKASGLQNVTVGVSLAWGHLFADSYSPTNPYLQLPRQSASGTTIESDVLSGYSFAMNTLATTVTADLPLVAGLTLSTSFGHIANFKHQFGNDDGVCDAQTLTGCVDVPPDPNATLFQPSTLFRAGLSYDIREVVNVGLGYENISGQIGEGGLRRNVFYSPGAQFYVDITANLDSIYSKATKSSKKPAPKQSASR